MDEFLKGYKIGVHDGKEKALLELQQSNKNSNLPSNETLYKIFDLLFECKENDAKTSSCFMNEYEHYANYITKNWKI
jgi:hypothetical protein